jgi:hypothetical protein
MGALLLATCVGGCGDDDDKKTAAPLQKAVDAGPKCSAGAKECIATKVARVCPADGSGWLTQTCGVGETCQQGECKLDPNAACLPGASICVSDTSLVRCKADAKGFDTVNCPADTTCQAGACVGACVVGSSICMNNTTLATCNDGKVYAPTACAQGQGCVATAPAPFKLAACKAADCLPSPTSCASVCGDKTNPSADATKSVSSCVETPNGWKWQVTQCLANETCAPNHGSCPGGQSLESDCATECVPGTSRCVNAPTQGVQVCGQDGKWAAITNCASDPAQVCFPKPGDAAHAVCGDPICALTGTSGGQLNLVEGACTADGQIQRCDANGKLLAATACTAGQCVGTAAPVGNLTPGACRTECQAGDEQCVGSASFRGCSNGHWSTTSACTGADGGTAFCYDSRTAAGRPAKACGVCRPGDGRCVAGSDAGVGDAAVQICGDDAQWGAATTCTLGKCTAQGSFASCVAECVPGKTVCVGANKQVASTPYNGKDSFGTCTSQGLFPTTSLTVCTGNEVCRTRNGEAIAVGGDACLECIGPQIPGGNEDGLIDARCSNVGGTTAGGAELQTCSTNNTWTANVTSCTGQQKLCTIGVAGSANKVDVCSMQRGHARSQTYYSLPNKRWAQPGTCENHGRQKNYGPPTQCGVTPDCCTTQCTRATQAQAARCQ